jgi:glutamyl-tRNA reductase
VQSNLEDRMREARRAEAIIDEELAVFEAWIESLEVVPTIAAIRAAAEQVREEEYARALKRLGTLSEKDLATVEALSQAIVSKILHAPTARLRDAAAEKGGYAQVEVARMLYGLDDVEKSARSRGLRALLRRGEPARNDDEGECVG